MMKWACALCALAWSGCAFDMPREALDAVCGDAIEASKQWCDGDERCRTINCECVRFETLECASVSADGTSERVWCDENGCYR